MRICRLLAIALLGCSSHHTAATRADGAPGPGDASGDSTVGPGTGYACGTPPCGPVSLAEMQMNPGPIAVAGGRTFWLDRTDSFDGVVRVASISGSPVADLSPATDVRLLSYSNFFADDQSAYWAYGEVWPTTLAAAPVTGTMAHTLYTDPATVQGGVDAVAGADGAVYVHSSEGLLQIDPTTGIATTIDPHADCYTQMIAIGTDIYCLSDASGVTHYALPSKNPSTVLAGNAFAPDYLDEIAVHGNTLVIMTVTTDGTKMSFYAMPLSGGTPTPLATQQPVGSLSFVANDAGIFWVAAGSSGSPGQPLMRLALTGGTPTVVDPVGDGDFLAADAHGVYLSSWSGNINEYAF